MELSKEQKKALALLSVDECLIRMPGGFWTTRANAEAKQVPPRSMYVGTKTINALISKGFLQPTKWMERGQPREVIRTEKPAAPEVHIVMKRDRPGLDAYYPHVAYLDHDGAVGHTDSLNKGKDTRIAYTKSIELMDGPGKTATDQQ